MFKSPRGLERSQASGTVSGLESPSEDPSEVKHQVTMDKIIGTFVASPMDKMEKQSSPMKTKVTGNKDIDKVNLEFNRLRR